MTQLTETQKQLLFDYCIGLTSEVENAQAQELVFSNDQAARFVTSIKATLSPLDSISADECPDELAEGTIWRAQQAVRTSKLQLTQLIAAEQRHTTGNWGRLFRQLATAAVFVIVGSFLFTGVPMAAKYARQLSWQHQCQAQLAGLFNSLSNYRNDNNGQMPAIAAAPGAPWWRVGEQGAENVSNTRKMWILVRNGYAQPTDFMCPALGDKCQFPGNPSQFNDFPQRRFVVYSFRIGCPKAPSADTGRRVIISDMNPIFKDLPALDAKLVKNLSKELMKLNSPNHNGRGQNVLFCDGSVTFVRGRSVDASGDDIFTLQNTSTYEGVELPATEADAFLAP